MPRLPRYTVPGLPQHVVVRGNNRTVMFAAEDDYRFFHERLVSACKTHSCRVHAYVFMTNHVHLLMTPSTTTSIAKVMQDVGRRYVRRFNDKYGRTGTLWDGRYWATIVQTERYVLTCQRYIELNPVRAGLASHPRDYRWSSHRVSAHGGRDALVSAHECYIALGGTADERRRAYRAICRDAIPESVLAEIRDATRRRTPLGSKHFRESIAKMLQRRVVPAFKGRSPATTG